MDNHRVADAVRGSDVAGTVVPKPTTITFEQAAAVPMSGFTALQSLRDRSEIQPGHRVLINGAGDGIGTAVQIAKSAARTSPANTACHLTGTIPTSASRGGRGSSPCSG